ncbi:hypothetical protein BRDCF_p1133 [Bacteroidales bacterium CF]|nr:hypothetical protein BRDCF_p1133 [Bacteroidales bacterium CF]
MPLYITELGQSAGRIGFIELWRNALVIKINFYLYNQLKTYNKVGMPKGY